MATFLLVFVQARLRAYREVYWSRLVSAVLLLAAVPLTLSLPAFGGLIVITGIVAVAGAIVGRNRASIACGNLRLHA